MNVTLPPQHGVLNKILESLGISTTDIEQTANADGYRIDFDRNFTIELHQLSGSDCRVSARIFSLGKSLQVQENQIKMALAIFLELVSEMPAGVSTVISDHDNCLRLCIEITSGNSEVIIAQFQGFIHIAFAYKQTYFKHKGLTT